MLRIYIVCLILSGYCFGADGEVTKASESSRLATEYSSSYTKPLLELARDALFTRVPKGETHPNFKDAGDSFIVLFGSINKFYGMPIKRFKILHNLISSADESWYSKDPTTVSNLYIQSAIWNYVTTMMNSVTSKKKSDHPVELSKTKLEEPFDYKTPLYIQIKEYGSETHADPSKSPLFKILMSKDLFDEEKYIDQLISHTLDYIKLQKLVETYMTNIAKQWGFEHFSPFVTQTELHKKESGKAGGGGKIVPGAPADKESFPSLPVASAPVAVTPTVPRTPVSTESDPAKEDYYTSTVSTRDPEPVTKEDDTPWEEVGGRGKESGRAAGGGGKTVPVTTTTETQTPSKSSKKKKKGGKAKGNAGRPETQTASELAIQKKELDKEVLSEQSEFFLNIAESSERFKRTPLYREMFKGKSIETVMTSSIRKMTSKVRLEFYKLMLLKKAMLLDVVSILEEMQGCFEGQLFDFKTGEFIDLLEHPKAGSIREKNRKYYLRRHAEVHGSPLAELEDEDDGSEQESGRAGGGGKIVSGASQSRTAAARKSKPLAAAAPPTPSSRAVSGTADKKSFPSLAVASAPVAVTPTVPRTHVSTESDPAKEDYYTSTVSTRDPEPVTKEDDTPWEEVGGRGKESGRAAGGGGKIVPVTTTTETQTPSKSSKKKKKGGKTGDAGRPETQTASELAISEGESGRAGGGGKIVSGAPADKESLPSLPVASAPVAVTGTAPKTAVDNPVLSETLVSTESEPAKEDDTPSTVPTRDPEPATEEAGVAPRASQTGALPFYPPFVVYYPIPVLMPLQPYPGGSHMPTQIDIRGCLLSENGYTFQVTIEEPEITSTLIVTVRVYRGSTTFTTTFGLLAVDNSDLIHHTWHDILLSKFPGMRSKIIKSSLSFLDTQVRDLRGFFSEFSVNPL